MPPAAMAKMGAEQLNQLPPATFKQMTPDQVKALPSAAFAGMTGSQLGQLPSASFKVMEKKDISLLSPEAVGGLQLSKVKSWSISQLGALTPEAAAALPTEVFNGLSAAQKAVIRR
jgi:hypothetical protein